MACPAANGVTVLTAVAGHRLRPAKGGGVSHRARAEMVAELLKAVAVP